MFDSQAGPPVLVGELRAHCEIIHRLAAPLAGHGKLVIARFGEDPDQSNPKNGARGYPLSPLITHIAIGDVEAMVDVVSNLTVVQHSNVYGALAVFGHDLPQGKKGFEKDIVAVLGLVADFDDADAPRWAERLPLPPNFVLETSTGRFQAFYFLDKPEALAAVKPVAARLKASAGCDHGTADLSHVWRIAGTLNWPNAKKVGAGRPREPQTVRVVKEWDGSATSLDALVASIPDSSGEFGATGKQQDKDVTHDHGRAAMSQADYPIGPVEPDTTIGEGAGLPVETIVGLLPDKLRDRIVGSCTGDRSRDLFYVISGLVSRRLDDATIERIISHYPEGIGAKYSDRIDLDREIRRIRDKASRRDQAQSEAAQMRGAGRPILQVAGGAIATLVDQAELLLIGHDDGIYEFGDQLVRPAVEPIRVAGNRSVPGLRLIPIGIHHLIERFTHFIDFQRFDARTDQYVSIDCPRKIAATYLERIGVWRLRKLFAITTCPVLRPDGTVLDKPGSDEMTGILFDPRGVEFPSVPEVPSRDDALTALKQINLKGAARRGRQAGSCLI
jgi:hypothetical protein